MRLGGKGHQPHQMDSLSEPVRGCVEPLPHSAHLMTCEPNTVSGRMRYVDSFECADVIPSAGFRFAPMAGERLQPLRHPAPLSYKTKATAQKRQLVPIPIQHTLIQIVSVIESKGDIGKITPVAPGDPTQGIAYGMLQLLSRHGGLDRLLLRYQALGGKYARQLLSFGSTRQYKVANHPGLQRYLKKAASDPLMAQAQLALFRAEYLQPALVFGKVLELQLPASFLIVFDTFVHFGPKKWIKRKLKRLVNRYGERNGLMQYTNWMKEYLQKRYATYGTTHRQRWESVRYNRWRVHMLQQLLTTNPLLQGPILLHAPQWRKPVLVHPTS